MRLSSFGCLLVVLGTGAVSHAQQSPAPSPTPPTTESPSTPAPSAPAEPPAAAPPAAEPPAAEPPATEPASPSEAAPSAATPSEAPAPPPPSTPPPTAAPLATEIPSPGELGDRLVGDLPPEAHEKPTWTAPSPVLTLHGYLRVRGELMDTFWLGRGPNSLVEANEKGRYPALREGGLGPDPFTPFRPYERSRGNTDCASQGTTTDEGLGGVATCDVGSLSSTNLRFRLSPQLNISEDVRIKATFDVFDNFVLGSGPTSYYGAGAAEDQIFVGTDLPTGQTIVARRAWAEVRNRDLGELRFGIMPEHWGLGMLYNSGNKLDDDYSTDFGRVMGITKIAGFYLSAAYDFAAEGAVPNAPGWFRPAYDQSQLDDVDQFTFSVVRRVPDEDEAAVLERGDLLLNGGVHFQMRNQDSRYDPGMMRMNGMGMDVPAHLQTLDASLYTPDIWIQLRTGGLRLELEAAAVFGSLNDTTSMQSGQELDVLQFGAAFEGEFRLLDDKLGLYFYSGIATGDNDVEGLSSLTDFVSQAGDENDGKVTTFRMHPSYRVDQILWRNIMRQVTGAYYFRPGISYDFVKDDFGQLFGARLDVIWSRATAFVQTPGNESNLGVELNAQIYWRSDDGPDVDDGYHAALQYAVLFPLSGLGYYHRDVDLDTAQSLRLVLGVVY